MKILDKIDKYLEEGFEDDIAPQYKALNDAEVINKGLGKGQTEIWYMNEKAFLHFSSGPGFLKKYAGKQGVPPMPTPKTVSKTHVLLGKIKESNLEKVFQLMQGETWSPMGEARNLIRSKKLRHTSMSMGDIVKSKGKFYMVASFGFEPI